MGVRRFELEVPAPFRLDLTVWALRRRAHNAIDDWDGTTFRRTLVLGGRPVGLAVRQEPGPGRACSVLVAELAVPGPGHVMPLSPRHVTSSSGPSGSAWTSLASTRSPNGTAASLPWPDVLSACAHRACRASSRPWSTPWPASNCRSPSGYTSSTGSPSATARSSRARPARGPGSPPPRRLPRRDPSHLRSLGFSQAKARALTLLARRVATGQVDLAGLQALDDQAAVAAQVGLPGIGRWSAEYVLLRGLGRWHVLPGDDVGARNNLRRRFGLAASAGYDAVAELARAWWPYSGIVYFHLLLDGLDRTGQLAAAGQLTPVPRPCS